MLVVGGKNFTLFGRPLIQTPIVTVNATVVEKTTSYPQLRYQMVNHAKVRNMLCKWFLLARSFLTSVKWLKYFPGRFLQKVLSNLFFHK